MIENPEGANMATDLDVASLTTSACTLNPRFSSIFHASSRLSTFIRMVRTSVFSLSSRSDLQHHMETVGIFHTHANHVRTAFHFVLCVFSHKAQLLEKRNGAFRSLDMMTGLKEVIFIVGSFLPELSGSLDNSSRAFSSSQTVPA